MADLSPIQKELLGRADSIFGSMAETATKAADFAKEQIPDIAYQYIAMERVYLTFIMIVGTAFFALAFWLFVWGACKNIFRFESDDSGVLAIPSAFFSLIGFAIFSSNLKDFLMVWFAPKIFFITHIVSLVKG